MLASLPKDEVLGRLHVQQQHLQQRHDANRRRHIILTCLNNQISLDNRMLRQKIGSLHKYNSTTHQPPALKKVWTNSIDGPISPRFVAQELLDFLNASVHQAFILANACPTSPPVNTTSDPSHSMLSAVLSNLNKQRVQTMLETKNIARRAQEILNTVDQRQEPITAEQEMLGLRAAVSHLRKHVGALPSLGNNPPRAPSAPSLAPPLSPQQRVTWHANLLAIDRCKSLMSGLANGINNDTNPIILHEKLQQTVQMLQQETPSLPLEAYTSHHLRTVTQGRELNGVHHCLASVGLDVPCRSLEGLCLDAEELAQELAQKRVLADLTAAWGTHAAKGATTANRREITTVLKDIAQRSASLLALLNEEKANKSEATLELYRLALETEKRAARAARELPY
jgi:hypothetical protein